MWPFRRRRGRMPRILQAEAVVVRRSDGALYAPHHGGAEFMAAVLRGSDRPWCMTPVRAWRGRFVAALDLPAWLPASGRDFAVVHRDVLLIWIGRKVAEPMSVGGMAL